MTKDAAIKFARACAQKHGSERFIVWSVEDRDLPGEHYHTAKDEDLDGFFNGCEVVATVQPDGTIETS